MEQPKKTVLVHFLDKHQLYLIKKITNVDSIVCDLLQQEVITREQHEQVLSKFPNQQKLEVLYQCMETWRNEKKDKVREVLRNHNYSLIRDMELAEKNLPLGFKPLSPAIETFLQSNRMNLIDFITMADPVLDDLLDEGVLDKKQYDIIKENTSPSQKMKEIINVSISWGDYSKYELYQSLCRHNIALIKELEDLTLKKTDEKDSGKESLKYHSPRATYQIVTQPVDRNFTTNHASTGINVKSASQTTCTTESRYGGSSSYNTGGGHSSVCHSIGSRYGGSSYNTAPEQTTPKITAEEMATGFLNTSPSLLQEKQDRMSNYNYHSSQQNERSHFIDRHCWDLIRVILLVDPVLDDLLDGKMLTQEQYNHIMEMTTPRKKMIELSEISNKWWHTEKDKLYLSLRVHNYHFIRVMEISDGRSRGMKVREHFLDRHRSELIRNVTVVNAVLDDLLAQNHLTQNQYNLMLRKETCQEKMVILYDISSSWDNTNKDKLYLSLRKENYAAIRDLEVKYKLQPTDVLESTSELSSVEDNKGMRISYYGKHAMTCSICLDIYTDPVTLSCGHSFCIQCITRTWSEQFEGESACPHCRLRFKRKPDLKKNLSLSELADCYRLIEPASGADKSNCIYCTDTTIPAVKRCLVCESFLCNDHLEVHCSLPSNVLLEVTEPLETRKCSIHGKILEYFCMDDACLICAFCCIGEDHRGHHMKTINEAAGEKKEKLRHFQEKLSSDMPAAWNKIQDLNDFKREMEKNPTQRNIFLTDNLKHILQENGFFTDNSVLKKEDLSSISTVLEKMEIKHSEMSRKVEHVERVCHLMDPFMVLSDTESESADFYNNT